jgi:5-methylthioribose kinase
MLLLNAENAGHYLREKGLVRADERLRVRELTGGVSNMVLLVERAEGGAFVLKQAREQLRTREAWFASVERAWREADVLLTCKQLVDAAVADRTAKGGPVARTPIILFEDRPNYAFAMTAAPEPHVTWKQQLLAGQLDPAIATACGRLLGTLHGRSWQDADIAAWIGDRALFDQLRVDPYYRALARAQPAVGTPIARLIESLEANACALTHADFSPKNLLVSCEELTMVDFETGHYGDPAFDLGFFLSHLVLKAWLKVPRHDEYLALAERFRVAYCETMAKRVSAAELASLWSRGIQNLAGCAWARLDGKSPVEYLSDKKRRDQIRSVCRTIFEQQPRDWSDVIDLCRAQFLDGAE